MDFILGYAKSIIEEAKKFVSTCFEQNKDFRKLDFETQTLVITFSASALATFRLVLLANKMRDTDFFKE